MRTFLVLLLIVAAFVGGFAVAVALQPAEFHLQRSTAIAAAPGVVFEQINDLHNWPKWSPWAELDPNCKYTYEGPSAGTGASCAWAGNKEVGKGKMTIVESRPNELVKLKLEFFEPFEATNTAEFTLRPEGEKAEKTEVRWAMDGESTFMIKTVHLLLNMHDKLGQDFDKGLSKLKVLAEGKDKK